MTNAGYAHRGPRLQAEIIQESSEPMGRRATSSPDRSGAQSTDCAPSFSGRKLSQASDVASSDLLENVRLLAAGGIAGAVSKTVTAPLARLTILYQVRSRLRSDIASALACYTSCSCEPPCKVSGLFSSRLLKGLCMGPHWLPHGESRVTCPLSPCRTRQVSCQHVHSLRCFLCLR